MQSSVRKALLLQSTLNTISSQKVPIPPSSIVEAPPSQTLPLALLKQLPAFPLKDDGVSLHLAVATQPDTAIVEQIRFLTGKEILLHSTTKEVLTPLLETLSDQAANNNHQERNEQEKASSLDVYLRQLIQKAIERRASDIHLEPEKHRYLIRIRVDGTLHKLQDQALDLGKRCVMRLKLLSGMDVAECRLPQDGALSLMLTDSSTTSFRLSTLPTIHGEKATLRVINSNSISMNLSQLGMQPWQLSLLQTTLRKKRGLVLVCGPTGSGKTITLYSALMSIDRSKRHVVSAENPVEHHLEGVQQVQVDMRIGLTFAKVLRAFLRQDPDIMMIGEVRDVETAEIMLKAAQTGHLVLATLHASSAQGCWSRLQQLGINKPELTECLELIIAQRLIPKRCPNCIETSSYSVHPVTEYHIAESAVFTHYESGKDHPKMPSSCHCKEGRHGRIGIFEFQTPPFTSHEPCDSDTSLKALRDAGERLVSQGIIFHEDLIDAL